MPEVSIIVPVYNAEKYLKECIESVISQTFVDFELILINDGSTDNSGKICDLYAKSDERIRVLHQKNKGQANARNAGIECAKGKWIHFVDSDDIIHPDMVMILYNLVKNNNVRLSMCSALENKQIMMDSWNIQEDKTSIEIVEEFYLKNLLLNVDYKYWTVWGKLIDINIVKKLPFTSDRIYEDNAVVCQWLTEAKKVADTDRKLYFYRINSEGTTKSEFSIKKLDYLWALETQLAFYANINYDIVLNEVFNIYMGVVTNYYLKLQNSGYKKKYQNKIHYKAREVYKKYNNRCDFEKGKFEYTFGVFHPLTIKIYWKLKSLILKIKRK